MQTKGLFIGELVKYGWNAMRANVGFFIGMIIVAILIELIPDLVAGWLRDYGWLLWLIFFVGGIVLSFIIQMGLIRISLKFADNEKAELGDLFSCFALFFKYLIGAILYGLIVVAGTILLVFPGVIWGIKFGFFGYCIVDKGMGPIEALAESSRLTMGAKWDLLGFWCVIFFIALLGILCLIIGIFAAYPTMLVATGLAYRKLQAQTEVAQAPAAF